MNKAMKAEFDTIAEWTAEIAWDLGPDYFLPAACRGSGNPASRCRRLHPWWLSGVPST